MGGEGYSIPVTYPSLPPLEEVQRMVEAALASREGPRGDLVSLLEQEAAEFLNTKDVAEQVFLLLSPRILQYCPWTFCRYPYIFLSANISVQPEETQFAYFSPSY